MTSHVKFNKARSADCISQGALTIVNTCSCGGAGCEICSGQTYVRPNFFAGQLLTEEDLQSLTTYVAAKNRLHNRYFFGEGIVCGLNVTCHPCGDGKVVVAPGYALDCCGNDIVLACPIDLDINAMVRELRVQALGGYDCGDPCAEKNPPPSGGKKEIGKYKPTPPRCYCLYIRYCEQPTDLVTPYGTGEPCVNPACEPTRMREGVKFELRCREEEAAPDDLFVRWLRCFGDLLGAKTGLVEAPWLWTYACRLENAKKKIQEAPTLSFGNNELTALNTATTALTDLMTRILQQPSEATNAPQAETSGANIAKNDAHDLIEAVLNVTSLVALYLSSPSERRTSTDAAGTNIGHILPTLRAAFGQISSIQTQINEILSSPLENAYATALFAIGNEVIQDALTVSGSRGADPPSTPRADPVACRYLVEKAVLRHDLLMAASQRASALRDWLLCQLDKSECLTDCTLRDEVVCIQLSGWSPNALANAATTFSTATVKLLEALFRYLQECLCCALNPPCPPCDDTAVLLACLEVQDCKVVKICDLERTFVLTPLTLRYWLPPLRFLGELIEKLCCLPICLKCNKIDQDVPKIYSSSPEILRHVPTAILINLFGLANERDADNIGVILGALGNLIRTESLTSTVTRGNLLATAANGRKAIEPLAEKFMPFLAPLQGLASLLGAETPVSRQDLESLRNENELLKQRLTDLEARTSNKTRTPKK